LIRNLYPQSRRIIRSTEDISGSSCIANLSKSMKSRFSGVSTCGSHFVHQTGSIHEPSAKRVTSLCPRWMSAMNEAISIGSCSRRVSETASLSMNCVELFLRSWKLRLSWYYRERRVQRNWSYPSNSDHRSWWITSLSLKFLMQLQTRHDYPRVPHVSVI